MDSDHATHKLYGVRVFHYREHFSESLAGFYRDQKL